MVGKRLLHYEIVEKLGQGAMGAVYRARDTRLDREVAIKIPEGRLRATDRERVVREARAASRAQHPNILTIYELGEHRGRLFIVMEYVVGESLMDRIERGALSPDEVLPLAVQMAEGLAQAHDVGVLHRDLKPANVMLTRGGQVKLADFGLARLSGTVTITESGTVVGTPAYFAPEIMTRALASEQSDVWALGLTIYEMLTGQHPFMAGNIHAIAFAIVNQEAQALRDIVPSCPESLAALIHACLEKAPDDRPSASTLAAGLRACMQGGSAPPRRSHNIPRELTNFIGRNHDLQAVERLVRQNQLVTVTGTGGAGKTRLAQELGLRLLPDFEQGVWWADLSGVSDPDLVIRMIAESVGVRESSGRELSSVLVEKLSNRSMLLIIDNAEHLVDPVAQAAELILRGCPAVRLLVTSRALLGVPGEAAYSTPPLRLPPEGADLTPAQALGFDAVQLFEERAAVVAPGFELNIANMEAVTRICRQLDGLPLAIELAAARIRILSASQIAERLGDRFKLLTSGVRTNAPRQQTLLAAIEWSHELLNETERVFFRRLSVFAAGWTLESAEDVLADDLVPRGEVLDLMGRLVDQSLVIVQTPRAAGPSRSGSGTSSWVTRYRLLESIHHFAKEKLARTSETEALKQRHADWYLDLALRARSHLSESQQAQWLDLLQADIDNLRAALAWLSEHDPRRALRLVAALAPFWATRGDLTEGRRRIAQALQQEPTPRSTERADALLGAGQMARMQADFDSAWDSYQESSEIARETGDRPILARALNGLGSIAGSRSDYAKAIELHEAALVIHRELGDLRGVCQGLNNLGNIELELGHYARGAELYEESLACTRDLGDERQIAISLYNLGYVSFINGDYIRAAELLTESHSTFQRLGHREGVAMSLMLSGRAALKQGDVAAASTRLQESLLMSRKLGNGLLEANARMGLGDVALATGDHLTARRELSAALSGFMNLGSDSDAWDCIMHFIRLAVAEGRFEEAARLLGARRAARARSGLPPAPAEQAEEDQIAAALPQEASLGQFQDDRGAAGVEDLEAAVQIALAAKDGTAIP